MVSRRHEREREGVYEKGKRFVDIDCVLVYLICRMRINSWTNSFSDFDASLVRIEWKMGTASVFLRYRHLLNSGEKEKRRSEM